MNKYWQEIEEIFKPIQYGDLFGLNDGASNSEIENLESLIRLQLPQSVLDFYRVHNGQIIHYQGDRITPGLFFGWGFVPIESIIRNWQTWKELKKMNQEMAEDMSCNPPDYIKKLYINDKWIPLIDDFGGNHLGIDLDPDIKGIPGQVILFGRDEDVKRVLANSFTEFIEKYIYWLKNKQWNISDSGEWEIDERDYHDFFYSYYRIEL